MLVPAMLCATALANPAKWVTIFNGKDLKGWTPKITGYPLGENFGKTFQVKKGAIVVDYSAYKDGFKDRFGHLFYKAPFSDYRLRLKYRFTGEQVSGGPGWAWRNSGLMIHCQDPKTMTLNQNFPVSAEIQFLGMMGEGERSTANLCTPGTHVVIDGKLVTQHCVNSSGPTLGGDQWVQLEIDVRGSGKVQHMINGKVVMEYEQIQLDANDADAKPLLKGSDRLITSGYISLQSESHPVEFKEIQVLER
jgi:hypothetical protein